MKLIECVYPPSTWSTLSCLSAPKDKNRGRKKLPLEDLRERVCFRESRETGCKTEYNIGKWDRVHCFSIDFLGWFWRFSLNIYSLLVVLLKIKRLWDGWQDWSFGGCGKRSCGLGTKTEQPISLVFFFFFFETLSEDYFICIEFCFLVHLLSGVGISGGFVWNFHFVWHFLLLGLGWIVF